MRIALAADVDMLPRIAGSRNRRVREDHKLSRRSFEIERCDADSPAGPARRRVADADIAAAGHECAADAPSPHRRQSRIDRITFGDAPQIQLHPGLHQPDGMLRGVELHRPISDRLSSFFDGFRLGQLAGAARRRQSLTSGPTVTSNAPPVNSDFFQARSNTRHKSSLTCTPAAAGEVRLKRLNFAIRVVVAHRGIDLFDPGECCIGGLASRLRVRRIEDDAKVHRHVRLGEFESLQSGRLAGERGRAEIARAITAIDTTRLADALCTSSELVELLCRTKNLRGVNACLKMRLELKKKVPLAAGIRVCGQVDWDSGSQAVPPCLPPILSQSFGEFKMSPDLTQRTANAAATPSRRDFLKTSSVAAAAGAVASTLSIARSAHAASDDTIKIALIGCGGRGTGACGQALSTEGPVKLVAMADAFRDRLDGSYRSLKGAFKDRVDVPEDKKFIGFDAYQKAIDSGVDMVLLTTPPGFRPIHFEAAVKAGKNVFMEKPVATDAGGIRKVLAAAEEAKKKDLKVGVGLQRRHQAAYHRDHQAASRRRDRRHCRHAHLLERPNALGATRVSRIGRKWNTRCATGTTSSGSAARTSASSTSITWMWRIGSRTPSRSRPTAWGAARCAKGKDYGETFDHHCVEFEYADGSHVFSQCRHIPGCWDVVTEYAHGTKGTSAPGGWINVPGGNNYNFSGHSKDPYQVEHDDLFAAIRQNKKYNEATYGANSTMMAILGRMCTYSGKEITWDDALNSKLSVMPTEYSFTATPPTVPDAEGNYPIPVPGKTRVV